MRNRGVESFDESWFQPRAFLQSIAAAQVLFVLYVCSQPASRCFNSRAANCVEQSLHHNGAGCAPVFQSGRSASGAGVHTTLLHFLLEMLL